MTYHTSTHRCEFGATHKLYSDATCDTCNKHLQPVDTGVLENPYLQYEGALHIYLSGRYGEFMDTDPAIGEKDVHAILCEDCARTFLEFNSWMYKLIREQHMTVETLEENEDD